MKYERFADCLKRLMAQKKVSATALARQMGLKSRNSLFRILNDQTSNNLEAAFLEDMKRLQALSLNEGEWHELENALEISRVGVTDFLSNRTIRSLMIPSSGEHANCLCVERLQNGEEQIVPLREVLLRFSCDEQIDVLLFSCSSEQLLREIKEVLVDGEQRCRLNLQHYIYGGAEEIVQNIAAIQPLLFEPWYQPWLIEAGSCPTQTEALIRTSLLSLHAIDANGMDRRMRFVMADETTLFAFPEEKGMTRGFIDWLLKHAKPEFKPVKMSFAGIDNSAEGYVSYTEYFRKLEENVNIFSIKPDISISLCHPDLLIAAAIDGFEASGLADKQMAQMIIPQFYEVHLKRYNNFMTKKKPTHMVFSKAAMISFAKTGRQMDHFFGMRPYTPEERKRILTELRMQVTDNPYFFVYFLRDDSYIPQAEITLYEGRGVLFTKARTDYQLREGHAEALITHPDFAGKFRTFFMKDLLHNGVTTHQETLTILDELIALADK